MKAAEALQDKSIIVNIRGQEVVAMKYATTDHVTRTTLDFQSTRKKTRPVETNHIHHTRKLSRCSVQLLLTYALSKNGFLTGIIN